MSENFATLATIGTAGAAGSGATYWLNQINPWLAFTSGVLTVVFLSISIYKSLRKK
jgi:hypothetical protein